jgi:hypothetical protein
MRYPAMMQFEELDEKTRGHMLAEFETEEASGDPYRGERLSAQGRNSSHPGEDHAEISFASRTTARNPPPRLQLFRRWWTTPPFGKHSVRACCRLLSLFQKVVVEALQALGYTEAEARFLYIVATHSGYFTARQCQYFETEAEKLRFFCETLNIQKTVLCPCRADLGAA